MSTEPDDLRTDWPDEPGAEELARFAAALRAGLPALPDAAMGRVEQRMRREMAARRGRRIVMVAAALAACLLLAVGLGWRFHSPPLSSLPTPPVPETAGRVDDRYTVDFAAPQPAAAPGRPPLHFQDNASLFTN